ncbi:MAG: DUF3500 domain-containing protein [Pseudomonadota bacterium]
MAAAVLLTLLVATTAGQTADEQRETGIELAAVPDAYVENVVDAARIFLSTLDSDQKAQVLFDFDDKARTSGRDTSSTPSFCAVLAWCVGWGLTQCSLTYPQHVALQRLLSSALSDAGYQTLLAIMNRNRLIGEYEDAGLTGYTGAAKEHCPDLLAPSVFRIPEHCVPGLPTTADTINVGGNNPPTSDGSYSTAWEWPGGPPGLSGRHEQFCDYTIALFGEPGSDTWAIRFEGHHTTINLTFLKDHETGAVVVQATPLFLGSYPMVIPPPSHPDDLSAQATWISSQGLMAETLQHVRAFLAGLPDDVRQASFVPVDTFHQTAPLQQDVYPPWLVTGLLPDASLNPPDRMMQVGIGKLDAATIWHLKQLYRRFFSTMPPDVGDQYLAIVTDLLASGAPLSVMWAGTDEADSAQDVFVRVVLGSLLIEAVANKQWSAQNRHVDVANHLHAVLRDLSFEWDFDPVSSTEQHHSDH